jgi:hypothetical protein
MIDSEQNENPSPAIIYKRLTDYLNESCIEQVVRDNLDIVIDFHWFFLQSKKHKTEFGLRNPVGKWKYYAVSFDVLQESIFRLMPIVAVGLLPLVKFTNVGNVFSGEKEIVVYCFSFGPSQIEAKTILTDILGDGMVWGDALLPRNGGVLY